MVNLSSYPSDNVTPVKNNPSQNNHLVNEINRDLEKIEQRSIIGRNLINDILNKTGSSPGSLKESKVSKSAGKSRKHLVN